MAKRKKKSPHAAMELWPYFTAGYSLFKANIGGMLSAMFISWILFFAVAAGFDYFSGAVAPQDPFKNGPISFMPILPFGLLWGPLSACITGFPLAGLYNYFLKSTKKKKYGIKDLFPWNRIGLNFAVVNVIVQSVSWIVMSPIYFFRDSWLLAIFLYLVPYMFFYLRLSMAGLMVLDRGATPLPAIMESLKITRSATWKIFQLILILIGINLLGVLACGIGLLVSLPVSQLAWTLFYLDLAKKKPKLRRS